jgi:uncharacterized protein (DUF58 family)
VPIVREYQEEYFSRIGVVLDTDPVHADPRRFEAALSLAAGIVAKLSAGEALIDVLVMGAEVHALTVGRSLGYLDQALDLLACAEPSRFDGAQLADRLAPFLPALGAVIFVALAWDASRASFVQTVESRGTPCRTIVVEGPRARGTAAGAHDRIAVPVEALERKELLWL